MTAYTLIMDNEQTVVAIDARTFVNAIDQAITLSDGGAWVLEDGGGKVVSSADGKLAEFYTVSGTDVDGGEMGPQKWTGAAVVAAVSTALDVSNWIDGGFEGFSWVDVDGEFRTAEPVA